MGGRFPPNMIGDGFGFGGGFGMPDPFGMPRGFPPFGGPRFPVDFARGPMPGMAFPGRPPQPFPLGLDMMMGPGRGPMMGGMGMGGPGRPNRPIGMAPFMPPPPPNNRPSKREQRRPGGDRGDRFETASDQGSRGHENTLNSGAEGARSQPGDRYGRNALRDDDSESEEEAAPRRSRKR